MVKRQGELLHKDMAFTSLAIFFLKGLKETKLGRISYESRNSEQSYETSFSMVSLKALFWGVPCIPLF